MFTKGSILPKIYSKLKVHTKCNNFVKVFLKPQTYRTARCRNLSLVQFHSSSFYSEKLFIENENDYLFNILPPRIINITTRKLRDSVTINSIEELYAILDKNWRVENATSIVKCFKGAQTFCTENDINISDKHFDKLVDGLMDHAEKLSDDEMLELLETLSNYPKTDSYQSHNFHDVWSALDDICIQRIPSWKKDMLFQIADCWYNLQCGKLCEFVFEMLDRLTKTAKIMNVDDLVRCFFYFNVVRKKPIDFNYEIAVQNKISSMTVDQMAIIALGCFKSQHRIKLPEIIHCMIDAVVKNKATINDITLCGILKIVRFSANVRTVEKVYSIFDALADQIDRISWQCVLHTALLGTSMQIYHPDSMEKCCKRFLREYAQGNTGRIKDIERLLLAVTMFNHKTGCGEAVVKTAFDDLHMPYRRKEMTQHPRCAPAALSYCSMRGLYSNVLMNECLNKDFIKEIYGTGKSVARELYSLDANIDIDCPDYPLDGARLGLNSRRKAAKWLCEWKPNEVRGKPSALDKIALDIAEHVAAILGGHDKYLWIHVLPQYSKADLIVCKNLATNEFVRPPLDSYVLGDVVRAPSKETMQFYAIELLGWNHVVRRTNVPLGQFEMKRKQLETVGYKPIHILWSDFKELSSENKTKYIRSLLL